MLLFALAYIGGVLTILSPCILPVLPFVFARADQPFLRRGLPMLIGMGLTFAVVATLAAVGGGLAVHANQYGRYATLALLALFGVTLILPELSDRLTRPLVALGGRLSESADRNENGGGGWPSLLPASRPACSGRRAPGLCSASSSPAPRCKARTLRPPCCCSPMPPAPRRPLRSPFWSAAESSRP
jgi:hypothetical protein